MTAEQPEHCEHEVVCPDYNVSNDETEENPCHLSCINDTRTRPHTPAPERQRIDAVIKELEHLRDGQYNDVVGHNVRYAYDYAIGLLRDNAQEPHP